MISLKKLKILTPLQKLPKNVGDLGKGFKKLPKVQKIAKSGHTEEDSPGWMTTNWHKNSPIFFYKSSHLNHFYLKC